MPLFSTPVLLYHRVAVTAPSEDPQRLGVSPESFGAQMRHLAERGFRVVPLEDLAGPAKSGKRVAITFDDGYLDTYTNAFPILKRYGFPATVFVVTDYLGRTNAWEPSIKVPMMDWGQAREMAGSGISIQSHTCTHPDVRALPDEVVLREFTNSREKIREMLGSLADHLAYPYGWFDGRIRRLAERAGYRSAWAAGLADGGRYSRERFQVTAKDGHLPFIIKTSRCAGWIRTVRHI